MTSMLIEGWRGVNHSFSLVNQHQILELLQLDGMRLFHRDMPYAFPHWNREQNASGFAPGDQAAVDALAEPRGDRVDCIYRICSPYRVGPDDDKHKVVTFMISEHGVSSVNFLDRHRDNDRFVGGDNRIVTGSHWSRDRLVDWGFDAGKISVISHGVDTTVFYPPSQEERSRNRSLLGLQDDETVFLNIGLPAWNKGTDKLLLAFAKLRARNPKARLVLKDQRDLYGVSVERMIKDLAGAHPDLVRSETLSGLSILSQNFGRADLRALYGAVDCYVSPYRAEGFNLPVLEAIACGTPVIVTRGGATDDFCTDETAIWISGKPSAIQNETIDLDGRFVEPDLDDLVDAMDAFSRGRPAALSNFESGRTSTAEKFTWAHAARQIAQLAA